MVTIMRTNNPQTAGFIRVIRLNEADLKQPESGFIGGLFQGWLIPVGLAARLKRVELNCKETGFFRVLVFKRSWLQVSETALFS